MDGTSARAALGLPPDACRHEVKRAYRAQAWHAHPDRGGDRRRFEHLTAAYRVAAASPPAARSHRFLVASALPGAVDDRAPTTRRPRRTRGPALTFAQHLARAMAG